MTYSHLDRNLFGTSIRNATYLGRINRNLKMEVLKQLHLSCHHSKAREKEKTLNKTFIIMIIISMAFNAELVNALFRKTVYLFCSSTDCGCMIRSNKIVCFKSSLLSPLLEWLYQTLCQINDWIPILETNHLSLSLFIQFFHVLTWN